MDDIEPAYAILDHFHHGGKSEVFTFGSLTTVFNEAGAYTQLNLSRL